MKVLATCGGCRKTLSVDARHAGLVIRCPVCQGAVELPRVEATEASPPPTSRSTNAGAVQSPRTPRSRRTSERAETQTPAPKQREPSPRRAARRTDPKPYDSSFPDADDSLWNEFGNPDESAAQGWGTAAGLPKRSGQRSARSTQTSRSGEWGTSLLPIVMTIISVILTGIAFCLYVAARVTHSQTPDGGGGLILSLIGMCIGALLLLGGHVGVVVNAFREDFLAGVVAFVIGFYAVWFAFTRWEKNRQFVVMYVLGLVVMLGGLVMMPD